MAANTSVRRPAVLGWPAPMRWNFFTLGADIAFFSFGLSISSVYTVLPLFVHHLTPANEAVALIPAVRALGMFAPQLLVAPFVERRERALPLLLVLTTLERIPFLLLALGALWLIHLSPAALLVLFFLMIFIATTGSGLCFPAWLDLIARAMPRDWLGRFLGFWTGIGGVLGIGGAAASAWLIANVAWPWNFAGCFSLTFLAFIVSFVLLAMGREPRRTVAPHATATKGTPWRATLAASLATMRAQGREVWLLVRGDGGLRRLIVSNALVGTATMAGALFAVAALRRGGLSDAQVGAESTLLLLASTGGNFLWGAVGDRFGHKAVLMWGALCAAASALLALWAHGFVAFGLVFLLLGLFVAANNLAGLTFIAEYGPAERRPTYSALAGVAYAPFAIGAPVLGGWLADGWGYTPVFILAGLAGLAAAAGFQFWVPNPRHRAQAA